MDKDELKKMLEDDFFGQGETLDGLEDISVDLKEEPENQEENNFETEDEFNSPESPESDDDLSDDELNFDLDEFEFDDVNDDSLLEGDTDLDDLDQELSEYKNDLDLDNNKSLNEEDVSLDQTSDRLSEDIENIIEEPVFQSEDEDINNLKDINAFTNQSQNDKIIKEKNHLDFEENKIGDNSLDYNEFSDAMNQQEYINVKKIDFPELNNQITGSKFNVDLFSNIPVTIDVFLGKTTLSLKDVHDFSKGSVIELDKFYGEPLELKINGELVATGEVVAIDNKYGIMIKDIVKS